MSVSGISVVPTNYYQPSGSPSQFQQEFGELVSSLNSGSLSGAQQAYSSLSQLHGSGQGPSANPNSPFSQALSQIGQDLQSGNLTAAQQTLSSLQQARGGHHHHGHHSGGDSSTTSASTATSSSGSATSSTTNTLNITA
jgi:hypothetical protein